MRLAFRLTLLLTCVLLLTQPEHRPAQAYEMKLCEFCRRPWDESPSRLRTVVDANGHQKTVLTCSPYCLAAVLKEKSHYKVEATQIVNWNDRAQLTPPMLNVANAKFLINVSDKRDLSHDPDIAGFRDDKQRAAAKGNLGGESIAWDKVLEKCKKLAAESEDEEESNYRPKHHRKY